MRPTIVRCCSRLGQCRSPRSHRLRGGGGKAPKSDDEADSGCFAAGTKRTFIDMSNASGAACVGQQQADISMDHSDVHDDDESDENVTEDPLLAEWLVDIV